MADDAQLTVTVQILTRAQMNTGTPRVGPWTYHHVLPVRLYFSIASTLLQILVHEQCWKSARRRGLDALGLMTNNGANKNAIRLFVEGNIGKAVTAAEIVDMAKRCASPPFGGFGGPNPAQRTDDPHDQEEANAPFSASNAWWTSLKRLREVLYETYQLYAMPLPQQVLTRQMRVYEWCPLVFAFANEFDVAATGAPTGMENSDWLCDTAGTRSWTQVRAGGVAIVPLAAEPMRLRLPAEPSQYLDIATVTSALARPRSPQYLVRDDDWLRPAQTPP